MKTIALACVSISLSIVSCNSNSKSNVATDIAATSKTSEAAQKNLDAMHAVDNAFKTGDVSGIDKAVAADFVDHTDKGVGSRESLKTMIKMSAADKTMKMETTKEIADEDYVLAMVHVSGTGDGVSMPAGPYDMNTAEVVKFNNGKAVEHWQFLEVGTVSKMMEGMKTPEKIKIK